MGMLSYLAFGLSGLVVSKIAARLRSCLASSHAFILTTVCDILVLTL